MIQNNLASLNDDVDESSFPGHEAHPVAGSGTSSSSTGAIPRGRQGRRHSVQVTSLTKDMEKLKVGEGSHSNHSGTEKMSESRKKELRKLSQKRRSSKQSMMSQS